MYSAVFVALVDSVRKEVGLKERGGVLLHNALFNPNARLLPSHVSQPRRKIEKKRKAK